MNLQEREIAWIETNRDLIEVYPDRSDELVMQLIKDFKVESKIMRILILVHYTRFGAEGFTLIEDEATNAAGLSLKVILVSTHDLGLEFFKYNLYSWAINPNTGEEDEFEPVEENKARGILHANLERTYLIPPQICMDIAKNTKIEEVLFKKKILLRYKDYAVDSN